MNKHIVNIRGEKTIHFAEHEVLLSFDGDIGAEAFYEWWETDGGGYDEFCEYCRTHSEFNKVIE